MVFLLSMAIATVTVVIDFVDNEDDEDDDGVVMNILKDVFECDTFCITCFIWICFCSLPRIFQDVPNNRAFGAA